MLVSILLQAFWKKAEYNYNYANVLESFWLNVASKYPVPADSSETVSIALHKKKKSPYYAAIHDIFAYINMHWEGNTSAYFKLCVCWSLRTVQYIAQSVN